MLEFRRTQASENVLLYSLSLFLPPAPLSLDASEGWEAGMCRDGGAGAGKEPASPAAQMAGAAF